jgi:rubrerythrin
MPDEAMKKVTEGLKKAMQTEHEGHHFYMMAAQSTKDHKGREVFEQLAKEERDHADYLKAQYKSLIETGRPNDKLKLGKPADLTGRNPIFSEQIRSRLQEAHFEMTALAVGIQLELTAIQFYSEQAAQTDDVVAKTFYLELAEWETGHYRALLAEQENLKEDYWAGSGFAPF